MQRVLRHGAALLRRVIWLGMGLQVILGLIWMLNNMGIEHSFGVDWSSGGPVNRPFMQWGPLYLFTVRIVMGMAQWLHIPYYSIIYCLQLLAAFGSGLFFLKKATCRKGYGPWGMAVVLLSVPMAMQSHLALLPYSFLGSTVLVQLALVIELWRQERWSLCSLLPVYLCWMLQVLLLPEYLWFGGIPMLLTGVVRLWRSRGKRHAGMTAGVLVLASAFCIVTVGSLWQQREDGTLDVRQMVTARCIWSNLYELSDMWSPELREQLEWPALSAACDNPEVFYQGFFDKLEQLPAGQQQDYLNQMIDSAWTVNGKRLLLEMAYDGVGYLMPGIVISEQLDGDGFISLTGTNYWHFIRSKSDWSGPFMDWYCVWFWLAAVLAVLVQMMDKLIAAEVQHSISADKGLKVLASGLLMAVACACFYTLSRIGVYDYKLMAWWAVIWYAGTLMMIEEKKEE